MMHCVATQNHTNSNKQNKSIPHSIKEHSSRQRTPGSLGNKRSSLGNLRKSKSLSTADNQRRRSASNARKPTDLLTIDMTLKRRSTGCLSRNSFTNVSSKTNQSQPPNKEIWRAPGFYEIPNILGNAFLKAEPTPPAEKTFSLRPYTPSKHISKRPWIPVGPCTEIPQLPPLVRSENEFERKLRKALPKVHVSSLDPRNKYGSFKEIGTGVNGSVVRARHRYKKNLMLAIKRCRLDPDRDYRAAIVRELRIMMTGHINLIRLREVTLWRDDVWIAMDLMRCSVFAVLCQREIPEEYTIYITCEVLKALAYLHSKDYIHRDVKCENLLIGWNGEIKLADFGLATRATRRNRDRLGTIKWMAPEVIREQYYNEKIDLWSLGITVIEMMDRVPPHYLLKDEIQLYAAILSEQNPTFTYSSPTVYMRGLVAWLLDEDPANRPSAKEALAEIDTHVQNHLLRCATATDTLRFVNHVLPLA